MNKLKVVVSLVSSVAGMIVVLYVFYLIIGSQILSVRDKAEFDSAPNCASIPVPSSAGQPCMFEAVRVVYKEITHFGRSGLPHYIAHLQTVTGAFPTVDIDEPFYTAISRADVMTAITWRGDIVSLAYQGKSYQTSKILTNMV